MHASNKPKAITHELNTGTLANYIEPPNISIHAVLNTAATSLFTSEEASEEAAYFPATSEQPLALYSDLHTQDPRAPRKGLVCLIENAMRSEGGFAIVVEKAIRTEGLLATFPLLGDWVHAVLSKHGPELGWTVQRKAKTTFAKTL